MVVVNRALAFSSFEGKKQTKRPLCENLAPHVLGGGGTMVLFGGASAVSSSLWGGSSCDIDAEPPAGMSSSDSLELSSARPSSASSRSRTFLKNVVLVSRSTSPRRYVKATSRQFCFICKN